MGTGSLLQINLAIKVLVSKSSAELQTPLAHDLLMLSGIYEEVPSSSSQRAVAWAVSKGRRRNDQATLRRVRYISRPGATNRWRSTGAQLVCYKGEFERLPERAGGLGPWIGSREGSADDLRPHYRAMLAERGFFVVHSRPSRFAPER